MMYLLLFILQPGNRGVGGSLKSGTTISSTRSMTKSPNTTMLTVYIPSNETNLVTKSVPLRNEVAKSKEVCNLLAHMLGIHPVLDYGLVSIIDGKGIHIYF
jgi:hypothetical protein